MKSRRALRGILPVVGLLGKLGPARGAEPTTSEADTPPPSSSSWSPFRPPSLSQASSDEEPTPPESALRPPIKTIVPDPPTAPPRLSAPDLRYDLRIDVPLVVGGYVAWNTLQSLNTELARRRCVWCDDNRLDREVRNQLRWPSSRKQSAETISDLMANVATPALSVGLSAVLAAHDRRFYEVPIDFVLMAEAITLAGVVTQVVKYSVGRMRPDAHALPPSQRPASSQGDDAYVSFYSGHTSYAFALASSASTIAWMRQYPGARWVTVASFTAAATTGYLRIAADKHYLTDVLAAAGTASAIGFAVPYFFHRPVRYLLPATASPTVTPAPGGALLGLQGSF